MRVQRLAPVLVVALGLVVAASLILRKPSAQRSEQDPPKPVVEAVVVQAEDVVARVHGNGVVAPAQQVGLVAQVGGEVVSVSSRLLPGGRFSEGEVLELLALRSLASMLVNPTCAFAQL